MKPNPVVLVPGIMGSRLSLSGWTVWDESIVASRAIFNPSLFNSWIPLESGPPVSATYGNLIRWITIRKGYGPDDFFAFGYDWRAGIEGAAAELQRFVENKVRRGSQIIFLAHSLGCLVVRWSILEGMIPPEKIKLIIAAGPPFLGAPKAFKSVIELPDINASLNNLVRMARFVRPSIADQITIPVIKSLMGVKSLLEIMPPRGMPVLNEGGQQLLSAFQWRGWPSSLSGEVAQADQVQARLASGTWTSGLPRKLIVSDKSPTETGYYIDPADQFSISACLATEPGDGTVLIESARAFGSDEPELLVDSLHQQLLNDQITIQYLDKVL
jgi:hypothetical protein